MLYKGELHTLTKLSMRHQVCPSETCRAIISESIITMLMLQQFVALKGHMKLHFPYFIYYCVVSILCILICIHIYQFNISL